MTRSTWAGWIVGIVLFSAALAIFLANVKVPDANGVVSGVGGQITTGGSETSLLSWITSGIGEILSSFIRLMIPTSCTGI